MKKIFRYLVGMTVVLALFSSCDKWIDTELNIDPDSPLDVPLNLLLPNIQANMAFDIGGNEAVRVTGLWMQHFQGINRQSAAQSIYTFGNSDPNNFWNGMYATTMQDISVLIEKGEASESPHWVGVGKVCMALCIGTLTDLWGDVPYSEALNGVDILAPALDPQEQIYASINTLLNEAIDNLSAAENLVPVKGDMIYGGSAAKWLKAAYALKARYAIHTTRVNANAKTQALAAVANAFEGSAEDMFFQYGSNPSTEGSPLYQFMEQRGDIQMGKTLIDALVAADDPRLQAYASPNSEGNYVGGVIGVSTDADDLAGPNLETRLFAVNGVTPFISFVEVKFIEAEAALGTDNTRALAAYKDAVAASLAEWGVDADGSWYAANIDNETTASLTMGKIMTQKWIALFGQAEIYNDWRRSDNEIGLALAGNASIAQIPYRWPYPVEEQTYNKNVPQGRDLTSKVWWMGNAAPSPTK